jgi:hypothetical protein
MVEGTINNSLNTGVIQKYEAGNNRETLKIALKRRH